MKTIQICSFFYYYCIAYDNIYIYYSVNILFFSENRNSIQIEQKRFDSFRVWCIDCFRIWFAHTYTRNNASLSATVVRVMT